MELKTVFERVHVEHENDEDSIGSEDLNVAADQLTNTDPVPVVEPASAWLSRRAVALAALVLALATLAVVMWPGNLGAIFDRNRTTQIIGIPDASPAPVVQDHLKAAAVSNEPPASTKDTASANQVSPVAPVIANSTASDSSDAGPGNNGSHELPPPADAPDNSSPGAAQEVAQGHINSAPGRTSKTRTATSATKRMPYSAVRQRPFDDNAFLPPPHRRFRTRVVGNTPDGYLILRLPSGETAIVPPAGFPRRRVFFERRRIPFPPPPPFAPPYPLGD